MTDEQTAELEVLRLANEKGKFAVALATDVNLQEALERLQDKDWVRLTDVTTIADMPGFFRIFRLTEPAFAWLKETSS